MNVMFTSSMADALLGSSSSISSGSFFSASNLGDWGMIRSGTYNKLMKSYVSQIGETDTDFSTGSTKKTSDAFKNSVSEKLEKLRGEVAGVPVSGAKDASGMTADDKVISSIKSAAGGLRDSAAALAEMDFEESTKEELYEGVKKMADSYNSVITGAAKTNLASISQSVSWMTNDTKARSAQLAKVGITIGEDNQITVDKDKFEKANLSDVRTLFEGSSSLNGRIAQRGTGLYNLASNQLFTNAGNKFYSSSGVLK